MVSPGHGRTARAVVPVPFRGAYHERPFHLYHACHLRPHDRGVFDNFRWTNSACHYDEPGLEPYGAELLEIPVCIGVPGISNHGVRGNLLCFGTEYRHGWKYLRRDMGLHGLHGPAVLRPVQDRQPL